MISEERHTFYRLFALGVSLPVLKPYLKGQSDSAITCAVCDIHGYRCRGGRMKYQPFGCRLGVITCRMNQWANEMTGLLLTLRLVGREPDLRCVLCIITALGGNQGL